MIAFYSNIFHKIIYFTYDVIIIIGYHTLTTNLLIFFNQGQLFIRYFTFTIRCLKLQKKASLCQMIDSNNNIWLPSCISLFPGAYPFVWSILVLTTLGDNNISGYFFLMNATTLLCISVQFGVYPLSNIFSLVFWYSHLITNFEVWFCWCVQERVLKLAVSLFLFLLASVGVISCFVLFYFVNICGSMSRYCVALNCELFPHSLFYFSTLSFQNTGFFFIFCWIHYDAVFV